jgi:hypothetical protein
MTKPMTRIHDADTDTVIDREMTAAEFAQYKIDAEGVAAEAEQNAIKAAAKQAVLDKLGITAEELRAALG